MGNLQLFELGSTSSYKLTVIFCYRLTRYPTATVKLGDQQQLQISGCYLSVKWLLA